MKITHSTATGESFSLDIEIQQTMSRLWDRMAKLFGKDSESKEIRDWMQERTQSALQRAQSVQVVGMLKPVPLSQIYQPTRLVNVEEETIQLLGGRQSWSREAQVLTVGPFLKEHKNSVVTAGPGWGKTTFIHAALVRLLQDDFSIPILFTLREHNSINELEFIVTNMERLTAHNREQRIVLLADGYDEISADARQRVSELLNRFQTQKRGEFILTCREHYDIYDLKARRIKIADFALEDQLAFMDAYFQIFERPDLSSAVILDDLMKRGFAELLRHPLLLTLACIVKTSSLDITLRSSASLIETAILSLSLRWDQEKALKRESTTPLSSVERQKLLRRIAFSFGLEPVPQVRVIGITQSLLEKMNYQNVEPLDVLREMAQFYGVFVPVGDRWVFVHRSLQDFLAAQQWVQSGEFAKSVEKGEFPLDSRTAFAAPMLEDATSIILNILNRNEAQKDIVRILDEMFLNEPTFKPATVWEAVLTFVNKQQFHHDRNDNKLWCYLDDEFITSANSGFLDYVVQSCEQPSRASDVLAAYAISELMRRKVRLSCAAHAALTANFKGPRFTIEIIRVALIRLSEIPHTPYPDPLKL